MKHQKPIPCNGVKLNSGNRKVLDKLFQNPKPSNIRFEEAMKVFKAMGAEVKKLGKTSGSRFGVLYAGKMMVLHKPHPESTLEGGRIMSIRQYLIDAKMVKFANDEEQDS